MDQHTPRSTSVRSSRSFASRIGQRSLNLFTRRDSKASSSDEATTQQAIEEARKAYLGLRGNILRNLEEQRRDPHTQNPFVDLHSPMLSANGDIKSDFALVERVTLDDEKEELRRMLHLVYGTDSLEMSDNSDTGISQQRAQKPQKGLQRFANIANLRQTFNQLKTESARTQKQARRTAPPYPTNIIESEDMTAILNARGTVLLNTAFRNLSHMRKVIQLANLALWLWQSRRLQSASGYGMLDRDSEAEEKAYIAHRFLVLIRDDIYRHIQQAIGHFSDSETTEQKLHIDVFSQSMRTWQQITNRKNNSAAGLHHAVEPKGDFSATLSRLRFLHEKQMEQEWGASVAEMCR